MAPQPSHTTSSIPPTATEPGGVLFWLRWRAYYFRFRGLPASDAATRARDEVLYHIKAHTLAPPAAGASAVWIINHSAYEQARKITPPLDGAP